MREFNEHLYRAKLFDLSGNVRLNGNEKLLVVNYPRETRGRRLAVDPDGRAVLANYIRQEFGLPRGEVNATRFEWRSC